MNFNKVKKSNDIAQKQYKELLGQVLKQIQGGTISSRTLRTTNQKPHTLKIQNNI